MKSSIVAAAFFVATTANAAPVYLECGMTNGQKVVFNSMEISRVDLSFKRTVNILGDIRTDTGQCKLADAPKRQF